MNISNTDREILRNVAKKQVELYNEPRNQQNLIDWKKHNDFLTKRPMIQIEMWPFAKEIITPLLACAGEEARALEHQLYSNFANYELFKDDYPVTNYFSVPMNAWMKLFDLDVKMHTATDSAGMNVGFQYDHVIKDLKEDFHLFKKSVFNVDKAATKKKIEDVNEVIGDILPAKLTMNAIYNTPTQMLVNFMGMEAMLFSMYDYPEEFHEIMKRIADDTIEYFRWLEQNNLLLPTKYAENLGQGTWCFTDNLPDEPKTTKDVWGYLDSQETLGISPDMFGEFIFPYYKRIADEYGFLSYGCCEPVSNFWDYIKTYENMRRVSISAWCDEEMMGPELKGKNIVYHRKPSPNFLGVGTELDEPGFRAHIAKTIKAAQGCTLEITQRDVYTVHNDLGKVQRYVGIIREEIEKGWS